MTIVKYSPLTIHLGGKAVYENKTSAGAAGASVAITSNTLANPTVVTTATPHGLVTGNVVTISGVSTSSPTINGTFTVTVTGASTFTIPVNVATAGTGGSLVLSSSAITPGMLIERYPVAGVTYFRPHSVSGNYGETFAIETSLINKGVSDAYAAGDLMEAVVALPGATIWALVATGAPAIAIGDKLESAGDGTLRKYVAGIPLALALEALTNTSGANARLRVEIL